MKTPLRLLISIPVFGCLISWSPTDSTVVVGSNNDTDGYTDANMTMAPFRGVLLGTNNTVGTASAAFYHGLLLGNNNSANLLSSSLVGAQNQIGLNPDSTNPNSFVRFSGIFGSFNVLTDGCNAVHVSGFSNTVNAHRSIVAGGINTLEGPTVGSSATHSAAIGFANQIAASQAWTIGNSNTVTATDGVAIGSGLTSSNQQSVAFGKWNAPMGANDLFVIGNGSASNLSTALTILNDGSVIIPGEVTHSGNTILASATSQSLTVSGNVSLQGTTTAQNLTVSGNSTLQGSITADDFNSTGTATLTDLDATTLDVSGTSNLADLNAAGTTTVDDLDASGTTTLSDTTAQTLTVSGATVLQGSVILAAPQGDISMGIYAP